MVYNIPKYTVKNTADEEMTEQDEGGGDTTDGGGDSSSTNAVTTWETGLTRGPMNQITITVFDNVNRVKGNMIDQNSKWESGINRGKANTLT